jgi:O-antigen/teichoic acid export membrane protein
MSLAAKADDGATLRRIRRVFSMGVLSNVLTLATNFLIPPLFLKALGAERYGAWLYLFTIPMSLAMFDLGISAAFSTEVFKLHASGDQGAAGRMYRTGIKLIGALLLIVLMGAGLVVGWRHQQQGSSTETLLALFILCAYVLVGFFSELLSSAYKCAGRYPTFQAVSTAGKVAELAGMLALIPLNNFSYMAAAMLLIKLLTVSVTVFQSRRMAPELIQGSWQGLVPFKHLVLPSAMYAVNPLIMFIALQVPLLIIGPAAGMAAVVAYTTTRTLARLPLQISSQISFSLYTEYTRLHAEGRMDLVSQLFNKGLLMILALFAAYAVGGMLLGPWVYELWLKHLPDGFRLLFGVLLMDACFESLMRNKVALTSSLNLHARDTMFQLVAVCSSVGLLWFMSQRHTTLTSMIWPAAAVSVLGGVWAVHAGRRQLLVTAPSR